MKWNKIYMFLLVGTFLGFGFFLSTKLWLGDDTPIKNTWHTTYFNDSFYKVEITNLVWDQSQNEIFFELQKSKMDETKRLLLQIDVIGKDQKVYPILDVGYLNDETTEAEQMDRVGYSFSLPITDWRYIQFVIQTEDESGNLSNQGVLYADYREVECSEVPIILSEWLAKNKPVTGDENGINSTTGEQVSSSNQEETNKDETLKQEYTIEREPIILDGGDGTEDEHTHEIVETDEPIYTLEDYEHQQQKLKEEIAVVEAKLKEQTDNQDLQKQLDQLQTKLAEVQQQIKKLKGE
ncbi:hypothetical protein [Turicibacter bilis]|uniref:hypothetical protein n=1 Tax=Turicibacter bilis TaxID=2735723 RepID=UPI001BAFCB0C|nr:hypothetical protein [Turicibacter bilis]MBS3198972.1 hypothetical protein [Turicibacter bilis]